MTDTPHFGFIVAAYALAAIAILAMIVTILWDYRSLNAQLRVLEDARRDKDTSR